MDVKNAPGALHPGWQCGAVGVLVLATVAVFWPGIGGGFLLDDASNLGKLVRYGEVRDWPSLLQALGNGIAGPLGRPVSLLSFLMNDPSMPSTAYDYKYTNILLHALNALLLFWLLYLLTGTLGRSQRDSVTIAFLAAAVWVLHPLWVSTTLYVVQRMAMLATTFSLAALILYVKGRGMVLRGRLFGGGLRIGFGLGFFGALGLFSKENAGLLPLQVLTLEVFLFLAPGFAGAVKLPNLYRAFIWLGLVVPSVILLGYLLSRWPATDARIQVTRGFSMSERFLTESRILFEYLRLLLLPADATRGVFYDDVQVSKGLFTPWTTLPAQIGVLGLAVLAWFLRRRFAVGAVALAFFLVGHLMETWLVGLELAFEHRNYLPALLLGWPLAWGLHHPRVRALLQGRGTLLIGGLLLVLLSIQTLSRSALWSSPYHLSQHWVATNPRSERAYGYATETLLRMGRHREAGELLERGMRALPGNAVLALGGLQVACRLGDADAWVGRAERAIATDKVRAEHYHTALAHALGEIGAGRCPGLQYADVLRIAMALQTNPLAGVRAADRQRVHHLIAQIRLAMGDAPGALAAFRQSLSALPTLGAALQSAATLAGHGYPEFGLQLLDQWEQGGRRMSLRGTGAAETIRDARRDMMLQEFERVRNILAEEAARKEAASSATGNRGGS